MKPAGMWDTLMMEHIPLHGSADSLWPHDPDSVASPPQAIFEVISSEHSYLHSLEILIRMFKNSAELSEAMTKTEHHHLFSNISDVCEASKKYVVFIYFSFLWAGG